MADEKTPKLTKARVLSDFSDGERKYKCNELVSFEDATLKAYKTAGYIDDHPTAVAFLEKQAARAKAAAAAAAEE